MTRWARSGSSQRHQKPPQDATPWQELSAGSVKNDRRKGKRNLDVSETDSVQDIAKDNHEHPSKIQVSNKNDVTGVSKLSGASSIQNDAVNAQSKRLNRKKSRLLLHETGEQIEDIASIEVGDSKGSMVSHFSSKKGKKKSKKSVDDPSKTTEIPQKFCDSVVADGSQVSNVAGSPKKRKKARKSVNDPSKTTEITQKNCDSVVADDSQVSNVSGSLKKRKKARKSVNDPSKTTEISQEFGDSMIADRSQISMVSDSQEKGKKARKSVEISPKSVQKFHTLDSEQSDHGQDTEVDETQVAPNASKMQTKQKPFQKKGREKFMEKVRQNRLQNGILLLPEEVEDRLYKQKRNLRNKGMPGEIIKKIIRKERRREELKFRKTLRPCFNCRKIGHFMSECPEIKADTEQGTGICFKCGSTEHISSRCRIKTSDFPFATCFVCHEQGHLSRSCPKNKHGVYPKGGKCNLCGEIDHLRKDCPKLMKTEVEEELTVKTISNLTSVDEEVIDNDKFSLPKMKKTKVVKF